VDFAVFLDLFCGVKEQATAEGSPGPFVQGRAALFGMTLQRHTPGLNVVSQEIVDIEARAADAFLGASHQKSELLQG
jgi:hypothetical protein